MNSAFHRQCEDILTNYFVVIQMVLFVHSESGCAFERLELDEYYSDRNKD